MNYTLKEVRELATASRDDATHNHMYNMMRFMAGDPNMTLDVDAWIKAPGSIDHGDLPLYPDISPDPMRQGLQNHALVNSSIMVQNTVYSIPNIVVNCANADIKAIFKGWAQKRWSEGVWGDEFFRTGMEVEAAGMSGIELGIVDGRLAIKHVSCLDLLWDRGARSPAEWEFVFVRKRISKRAAMQKYPWLTQEDIGRATKRIESYSPFGRNESNGRDVIIEWSFWTDDVHVNFIGGIQDGIPAMVGPEGWYLPLVDEENTEVPGNPFGLSPIVAWSNPYLPGASRPSSRLELVWSQATWINMLELYFRETLMRSLPMTMLDESVLTESQVKAIRNSRGPADIDRIMITSGNPKEAIHRVGGAEIPASLLPIMEYAHRQLNAGTGVVDAQRGQPLPGERTALEVRTLNSSQGIQARHMKSKFAQFLKTLYEKGRLIASMYEDAEEVIYADGVTFDTTMHDIGPILEYPMQISVSESSLSGASEEDVEFKRIQQLQAVDLPAIQAGVADPRKVFESVYRDIGVQPDTRMLSEEQIALQRQMMESNGQSSNNPT